MYVWVFWSTLCLILKITVLNYYCFSFLPFGFGHFGIGFYSNAKILSLFRFTKISHRIWWFNTVKQVYIFKSWFTSFFILLMEVHECSRLISVAKWLTLPYSLFDKDSCSNPQGKSVKSKMETLINTNFFSGKKAGKKQKTVKPEWFKILILITLDLFRQICWFCQCLLKMIFSSILP